VVESMAAGNQPVDRRKLIIGSGAAAAAVWVAPSVLAFDGAAAASGGPLTVTLWKASASPSAVPDYASVCSGSAGIQTVRGSATFSRTENPGLLTITVVVGNPKINGDGSCIAPNGGRVIQVTQASETTCLSTDSPVSPAVTPSCFTAAPSGSQSTQTFTTPIANGARFFAIRLLQSGGGGTDSYWTQRVQLP
jgi:hypothetical protein